MQAFNRNQTPRSPGQGGDVFSEETIPRPVFSSSPQHQKKLQITTLIRFQRQADSDHEPLVNIQGFNGSPVRHNDLLGDRQAQS